MTLRLSSHAHDFHQILSVILIWGLPPKTYPKPIVFHVRNKMNLPIPVIKKHCKPKKKTDLPRKWLSSMENNMMNVHDHAFQCESFVDYNPFAKKGARLQQAMLVQSMMEQPRF